jgi:Sulfotransferase family
MTMPNFFIIGAQKAGTTSLYHYLNQHPQVYMSPIKEPHFFEGMQSDYLRPGRKMAPVTDPEDYRALFEAVSGEKAIGEASASYLYSPKAPALIRRSVPHARLIAVLRNPADRAYSNFLHLVRMGREPLTNFSEALQAEGERTQKKWGPHYYYRQKGFYYAQVKRYFDTFGRDQVRVWLYEDLKTDPVSMVRDIFRFLDIDETYVPDFSVEHNAAGLPKNKTLYTQVRRLTARNPALLERFLPAGPSRYVKSWFFVKPPPFPAEVQRSLIDSYTEDILKLQNLIGRDLSSWLDYDRGSASAGD